MLTKITIHKRGLQSRKVRLAQWKVPSEVHQEILDFLDDLALGKVNRGKRISESRQVKYLDLLRIPLEFLDKPTHKLQTKDIEAFEKALSMDQVQSPQKDQPYSLSTKADIRKALKVFLRWRLGEGIALQLAGWLDTRDRFKTPDYLTETEIETLFKHCSTATQRFIVAVLFDTGARAEEFINIRMEDVRLPEGNDNYVKITLREEFSKTKGRTISLYWRHSVQAVRDYVSERIQSGIGSSDALFGRNYDAMRMFLTRLGQKVLRKHVHPHLFRHSSATFYATKLNRQELCYRYGWKFSSNMPDIYISRAGMENKELDIKFTNSELGGMKNELTRITQENKIKEERITTMQATMEEMQSHLNMIADILASNASLADVQKAIDKKSKR